MLDLPMSLRLPQTEKQYQEDKAANKTIRLIDEPAIFKGGRKYFKIIENRYPYDLVFETHHMIVCKREGAKPSNFTVEEKRELEAIMFAYAHQYSCVIENFAARSVVDIWHVHLGKYYKERPQWLRESEANHKHSFKVKLTNGEMGCTGCPATVPF